MNVIQRWFWLRRVKREKRITFLARWNAACARLWSELWRRPVSLETLLWFERKHARLMRVKN